MIPTSIIALFCDDIREEKNGALTLVGVLGDNANVTKPPTDEMVGFIPKLCIYLRLSFDVSAELGLVSFTVKMPDGTEIGAGGIDSETLAKARETRNKGNPIGGVVSRLQFVGLTMKTQGRMTVEATIGDQTYVAGFLNFISEGEFSNS